jgi:hypothetical protein
MAQELVWEEGPDHRPRAEVHYPPLHFRAEVLLDEYGEFGPLGGDDFQLVFKVTCEVWDVNAYDVPIAEEVRVLGPELGDEANALLTSLGQEIIEQMRLTIHKTKRGELAAAEEKVKALRAIEREMSRLTLSWNAGEKRIILTPDLARTVLALTDRAADRPYRMELEALNLAACYNEHGILVGRIVFRPDASGSLGLHVYEPPSGIMRLFTEAQLNGGPQTHE